MPVALKQLSTPYHGPVKEGFAFECVLQVEGKELPAQVFLNQEITPWPEPAPPDPSLHQWIATARPLNPNLTNSHNLTYTVKATRAMLGERIDFKGGYIDFAGIKPKAARRSGAKFVSISSTSFSLPDSNALRAPSEMSLGILNHAIETMRRASHADIDKAIGDVHKIAMPNIMPMRTRDADHVESLTPRQRKNYLFGRWFT